VEWLVDGTLVPSEERKVRLLKRKLLFIVATNELDEEELPAEELLRGYKDQSRVERGFRFLRDPRFMASSFFLESERRIMALLMVMTLCLLVYSALEWRIREAPTAVECEGKSFPDQKGNPTQRPTARWVFESFLGIHVLFEGQRKLVLNMKERHNRILAVLGQRGVSAIMGFQPDRMMNRPDERLAVLSHLMLGETQSYAKIMHYSDDGGKTWYKNATIAHDGYHFFCEGALVILDGGEELARVMRENHSGGIPSFVAFSQDNGDT